MFLWKEYTFVHVTKVTKIVIKSVIDKRGKRKEKQYQIEINDKKMKDNKLMLVNN